MSIEWPPDEPLWVDTRSMLESGGARFGEGSDYVVCDPPPGRVVSMVGRPPRAVLDEALAAVGEPVELLAQHDNIDWARELLPGYSTERIILHAATGPFAPPPGSPPVRRLSVDDALDHLPPAMRDEVDRARARTAVFAAFIGGRAVSFVYAHRQTSTLADVAADTVEGHRRVGAAYAASLHLFAHLAGSGLAPTWGAHDANRASLALAGKLGFEPIGALWSLKPVADHRAGGPR